MSLRLQTGGVEGALAQRAEAIYEQFTNQGADTKMAGAFQRLFTRLVTLGEGQEDTRRVVEHHELGEEVWSLAQRLAGESNRLVVTNAPAPTRETVEVVHEALISHWPHLVEWINRDRAFQSWLRQIKSNVELWSANPADEGPLLRGGMLAQASDWLERRRDDISPAERQFIEASIALSQRIEEEKEASRQLEINRQQELATAAAELATEQRRRATIAVLGGIVALLFAALSGQQAYKSRLNERIANQNEIKAGQNELRANQNEKAALASNERAQSELNKALLVQSNFLTDLARQQNAVGDKTTALLLAAEALPDEKAADSVQQQRPYVNDARLQFYAATSTNRETALLAGHSAQVDQIEYSPNGQLLLSSSLEDKTARAWDVQIGRAVAILRGHTGRIYSAKFSPDGRQVVTASADGTAQIWDVDTGNGRILTKSESPILSAVFSPDGGRVLTASSDKTARVFEVNSGRQLLKLAHEDAVYAALFAAHGRIIVTASKDYIVRFWASDTGVERSKLDVSIRNPDEGQPDGIIDRFRQATSSIATAGLGPPLRISRDGKRALIASPYGSASVADVETGERISSLHVPNGSSIPSARFNDSSISDANFSPNGKIAAMSYWQSNQTRLWDVETGMLRATLKGTGGSTWSLAFSPDGRLLATAEQDGGRLWDVHSGELRAVLDGHLQPLWRTAFSPDGRRVATASSDRTIRIWNLSAPPDALGVSDRVPDNTHATVGSRSIAADAAVIPDTIIRIVNPVAQKEIAVLQGHEDKIKTIVLSSDSRRLVTTSEDKSVLIWNVDTGKQIAKLAASYDGFSAPVISWDGRRILTTDFHGSQIWDGDTGQRIAILRPQETANQQKNEKTDATELSNGIIDRAIFSPNGHRLATFGGFGSHTIRIWDVDAGRQLMVAQATETDLLDLYFSPTGEQIVATGANQIASIWNVETGQKINVNLPASGELGLVAFTPNGRRAAATLILGKWRVVNGAAGQPGSVLQGLLGQITVSSFSTDGARLATVLSDNVVKVWHVASGREIATITSIPDKIEQIKFAVKGYVLITTHSDNVVRVWNGETGQAIAQLRGHDTAVSNVIASDDGNYIATTSFDGEAWVWNAKSGDELWHSRTCAQIVFNPDSRRFATISEKRVVQFWDAGTGSELRDLTPPITKVDRLLFNSSGDQILIVSSDSLSLRELETGRPIREIILPKSSAVLNSSTDLVSEAQFEPDGNHVIFREADGKGYRWNVLTGDLASVGLAETQSGGTWSLVDDSRGLWIWDVSSGRQTVFINEPDRVTQVAFSPDGNRLASGSSNKIAIWDAATGRQFSVLGGFTGDVLDLTFSPDNARILATTSDGKSRVWMVATGRLVAVLGGDDHGLRRASFSTDGALIVTHAVDDTVVIWDSRSGLKRSVIAPIIEEYGTSLALVSNDAKKLVVPPKAEGVNIYAPKSRNIIAKFRGHDAAITSVIVSTEANLGVTTSKDMTAKLWELNTGALIATLLGHTDPVTAAAISPDHRYIATVAANEVRIWNASGQFITGVTAGSVAVHSLAISPDSRLIVTISDEIVRVWDALAGRSVVDFQGHEQTVSAVAFSRGGALLVTASEDNTIRVWDIARKRQIALLNLKQKYDTGLDFSDDSSKIVMGLRGNESISSSGPVLVWDFKTQSSPMVLRSARNDKDKVFGGRKLVASGSSAKIIEAETGREVSTLNGHKKEIYGAVWSEDGQRVATYSEDQTLRFWEAATGRQDGIQSLSGLSSISGALFSDDASLLITVGGDGNAYVWDIGQAGAVAVLADAGFTIQGAAFTPDRTRIFTLSVRDDRKAVRGWKMVPRSQDLVEQALSAAPRCLTLSQRKKFFLPPIPPRWCITGSGREAEPDSSKWEGKWPFQTDDWKMWLTARQRGQELASPEADDSAQ